MSYQAEFVGWAEKTGDSSEGAIVRVTDGDNHVLSAVVRVTRTLMAVEQVTIERLREVLPTQAVDLVHNRADRDPGWVEGHRGEDDVPVIVTDAGVLAFE